MNDRQRQNTSGQGRRRSGRKTKKGERVPGKPVFDARVIAMMNDIKQCMISIPNFKKGLTHRQWMFFADWHLGREDRSMGGPYDLIVKMAAANVLKDTFRPLPRSSVVSGIYIDPAETQPPMPDSLVAEVATKNWRAASCLLRNILSAR